MHITKLFQISTVYISECKADIPVSRGQDQEDPVWRTIPALMKNLIVIHNRVWITRFLPTGDLKSILKPLKGESQGHNAIFKGLKMTFRTRKLKKQNCTTLISTKNTKNFVLTTFLLHHFLFLAALLIAVNFTKRAASITLSDAPIARLVKLTAIRSVVRKKWS